jgi:hypothetical protein
MVAEEGVKKFMIGLKRSHKNFHFKPERLVKGGGNKLHMNVKCYHDIRLAGQRIDIRHRR